MGKLDAHRLTNKLAFPYSRVHQWANIEKILPGLAPKYSKYTHYPMSKQWWINPSKSPKFSYPISKQWWIHPKKFTQLFLLELPQHYWYASNHVSIKIFSEEIEKVKVPRPNVCALSECFIGSEERAFSIRSKEAWKRRKKKRRSSNYRNMKGWQRSIKEVWKRRKRKKRSSRYGNIEAWQRRKKKYNIQNCASGSRATLTEGIITPEA